MISQIDFLKTYWFYLFSDVYVSYNKEQTNMLLYNTCTGQRLEVNSKSCISLIKDVYKPDNLGVAKVSLKNTNDQELIEFIDEIIKLKMGGLISIEDEKKKPVNLLPILSLSKDVDKLKKKDDISLIIPNLISYLSELNIYINGECSLNCLDCSLFYRQIRSCFKSSNTDEMQPSQLRIMLEQLNYSHVKNINILGGNIFQYSFWDDLINIIDEYEFDFHLWANYLNFYKREITKISPKNIINEVLVTFPVDLFSFEAVFRKYEHNTKFHFLIKNEKQYSETVNLIACLGISNYCIEPIYTDDNIDFFSENVFLEKEDIFSSIISMRQIFCNQKLNANNFGSLIILNNGSVKANINTEVIGNIHQSTILELIYKELITNSAWRVIRNQDACSNCLYKYLCPPISNYETVIGKVNLCNIDP